MLAALFAGSWYLIYYTWIASLFPQKPKAKSGERPKRAPETPRKADAGDGAANGGVDGAASATGAKSYDESWIPQHHINRPEAKRVKTGGSSRPKSRGKPE